MMQWSATWLQVQFLSSELLCHPNALIPTRCVFALDDQTQVDSKPAGQPEHASLNQCQLIAP